MNTAMRIGRQCADEEEAWKRRTFGAAADAGKDALSLSLALAVLVRVGAMKAARGEAGGGGGACP